MDAGIDRAQDNLFTVTAEFGQHDSARAAVTLSTAFLGTGPLEVLAEVLQNGTRRIDIVEFDNLAVENKTYQIGLRIDFSCPGTLSSSRAKRVAARDSAHRHSGKRE